MNEFDKYNFLQSYQDLQIPIMLETNINNLGIMNEFDGNIVDVENIINFTYIINNYTITIFVNGILDKIFDKDIAIEWGDEQIDYYRLNNSLEIKHTYRLSNIIQYKIKLKFITPWDNIQIEKIINIPHNFTIPTELGKIENIRIPYTNIITYEDNKYNVDTPQQVINYMVLTQSRIDEKKLYGDSINNYVGIDIYDGNVSGYTIDGILYKDYPDGITTMQLSSFENEETIINNCLIRNQHFLGFVEQPTIYSDIYIERGKISVSQSNFNLINNTNVENISKYFNIEKY